MRRIARTVAASIVVILGLALVSAAAFNPETGRVGLPTAPDAPEDETGVKEIPPFDPESGVPKHAGIPQNPVGIFDSEFGKRGRHDVEVVVSGSAHYVINWRGDPEAVTGYGSTRLSRTINSGFPVVRVGINGLGNVATCVLTVDGLEKDRQSTSAEEPIVICEA